MAKFGDLKELSDISNFFLKGTIETSYEKIKNIANESTNYVIDDDGENNDYDWLEQTNSNENLGMEEQTNSKEQSDYKKNDIPIIVKKVKKEKIDLGLDLDFGEENLMQAMVYKEIFGKPKAKRRRRRL